MSQSASALKPICPGCRSDIGADGKCHKLECRYFGTHVIGTGRCVTCGTPLPPDQDICQNPKCVVSPNYQPDMSPPPGGWPAEDPEAAIYTDPAYQPPAPPAEPPIVGTSFAGEGCSHCPYCGAGMLPGETICPNADCPGKFPDEPAAQRIAAEDGTPNMDAPKSMEEAEAMRCTHGGAGFFATLGMKLPCDDQDVPSPVPSMHQRAWDLASPQDRIQAVQAERGAAYGDSTFGHTNLGLLWTALLQNHYGIEFDHPIPPSVVLTMLVAHKCNRMVLSGLQTDNFLDCASYADLAEKARMQETGVLPAKGASDE